VDAGTMCGTSNAASPRFTIPHSAATTPLAHSFEVWDIAGEVVRNKVAPSRTRLLMFNLYQYPDLRHTGDRSP
jgi:hypothetical protein